jgi:hypothetical protein
MMCDAHDGQRRKANTVITLHGYDVGTHAGNLKETIMAEETTFTLEEWETLRKAPVLAGMAVATASKSGQWGSVREEAALYDAIDKTAADSSEISLIQELAVSIKASPPAVFSASETPDYYNRALAECTAASNVLDARIELVAAQRYRNWVVSVGQHVAEASKEGAFLGLIGGKRVSEEEARTLNEIAVALRSHLVETTLGEPGNESDIAAPVSMNQAEVPFITDAAGTSALLSSNVTEREVTEYVRPQREAREVY